jgi:GNAT superfamily N-acetyltransferase
VRIKRIDDLEDARELWTEFQALHDTNDAWPGDDHTYWQLLDDTTVVAIMSAVYRPEKAYVYLSYAIVHPLRAQAGLQRRLIRYRLQWARRQGAIYAVTYTLLHNYPSIMNLVKCGFRFAKTPRGWIGVGSDVHYFEIQL